MSPHRAHPVLKWVPRPLITDTWQVMLAVTLGVLGLIALYASAIGQPGVMGGALGPVLRWAWGVSLVSGAILQLWGLARSVLHVERFGLVLCALGSGVYGLTLLGAAETPTGRALGCAFIFISLGHALRLWVTSLTQRMPPT